MLARAFAKDCFNTMRDSAIKLLHPRSIPVYYFSNEKNIGDLIGPYLIKKISGRDTFRMKTNKLTHLMSVGSILSKASRKSLIWGSGFIDDSQKYLNLDPNKIFAVRGQHSKSKLEEFFGIKLDIPIGDPALLMPKFFYPQTVNKKTRLGLIPHYVDFYKIKESIRVESEEIIILDVRQDPEKFIEQMLMCEIIASSSLHGLILADAYGIPNRWVEFSEEILGKRWKFKDYYSSTVNRFEEPLDLKGFSCFEIFKEIPNEDFKISKTTQNMDGLIKSFPLSCFT